MGVSTDLNLIGFYSPREIKTLGMVQMKFTTFNYPDKLKQYTMMDILFKRKNRERPKLSECKEGFIVKMCTFK